MLDLDKIVSFLVQIDVLQIKWYTLDLTILNSIHPSGSAMQHSDSWVQPKQNESP